MGSGRPKITAVRWAPRTFRRTFASGKWRTFSWGVLLICFLLCEFAAGDTSLSGAELKPETLNGFLAYVQATQARIQKQVSDPSTFLYADQLPEPRRSQVRELLKRGGIFMERLETRGAAGRVISAPGGLIHHWIGSVFIPGAAMRQVLDLVQDYNHHQEVYRPDVVRSRMLSHKDDRFQIFLRFREKKVVTVTLDTIHEVQYTRVDDAHWYSQSVATRIAEVENADKPNESEKPPGQDSGFLWRLNSYWRFVQRDGGVYVECESISLTRDIPSGLGWMIGPLITAIPRESLERTLGSTRSAVLARLGGKRQG
jgi:hypothetical protein